MKCFWEGRGLNPDDFYHAYVNRSEADWDKLYADFDACVDWPSASFYYDLFQKYPDAKVILTVRSAESWYESVKRTIYQNALKRRVWKEDHPNYAYHRMASRTVMHGVIGDSEKFENKELVKKLYEEHIEEVKRVIPADRLLVMHLGQDSNWKTLCKFLNKPIPEGVPFPRTNDSDAFTKYFAPINANVE